MSVYPFETGAVIIVTMKSGVANDFEKKQESKNLGIALTKTSLFSQDKINAIADKNIGETVIGIAELTKYVLFKNDKEENWSEEAAQIDVDVIIEKLRAKYGE